LDEADTFVEGQLANYDDDREASLSFCLLKELPAVVDSTDLPRIRTIFSGYRVTNTRDGVWANAGDPLVLNPLHKSEAISFVAGTWPASESTSVRMRPTSRDAVEGNPQCSSVLVKSCSNTWRALVRELDGNRSLSRKR
jgi:hypothetical protein